MGNLIKYFWLIGLFFWPFTGEANVWVQFENSAETPCYIKLDVLSCREPPWGYTAGYISSAGFYQFVTPPAFLIGQGKSSPWVDISSSLGGSACTAGGINNLLFLYQPQEEFKGVLRFAREPGQTIKEYKISQEKPRFIVRVSVSDNQTEVISAEEMVERNLAQMKSAESLKQPRKIRVSPGSFRLDSALDPKNLIEKELTLLRDSGFNRIQSSDSEILEMAGKYGLRRDGLTAFGLYSVHGFIEEEYCGMVKEKNLRGRIMPWKEREDKDWPVIFWDEPQLPSLPNKHSKIFPQVQEDFISFLKSRNVRLADIPAERWEDVLPSEDRSCPVIYFYTMEFRQKIFAEYLKKATAIFNEYGYSKTCVTIRDALAYYNGNMARSDPDWFLLYKTGSLTYGYTETWLNLTPTFQLTSYLMDILRSACRQGNYPYSTWVVPHGRGDSGVVLTALACLARGAEDIRYFTYGPSYLLWATDAFSTRSTLFPALARFHSLVAGAEEELSRSRVVPSQVAMLWSRTDDYWGTDSAFGNEKAGIYLALLHNHYSVDFLSEDMIKEGVLREDKVLFVSGSHIEKASMEKILKWVEKGGHLWLSGFSGLFDEFNKPADESFQLWQRSIANNLTRVPGGRKPGRRLVDTVVSEGESGESIDCHYGTEVVAPQDKGEILFRYTDGKPALILLKKGDGIILRCGFLPGLTYLLDAPGQYPAAVRNLVKSFLERAGLSEPLVETGEPLVETNILSFPGGFILPLINYTGAPVKDLQVIFAPGTRGIEPERLASGGKFTWKKTDGKLIIQIPEIKEGDFLILREIRK